jgi:hypothetical protein
LAATAPPPDRPRAGAADQVVDAVGSFARTTVALHRRVAERFTAAIGVVPTQAELREYDDGRDLDRFFWFLMQRPVAVSSSPDFVRRLVDRLVVLHECFEQALIELALPRPEVALREPAARSPERVSRPDRRCSPAS